MIIKYEFLDGKKIEIAVSTELGQVILQIDKKAKNNDRRETRRHQSLSKLSDKADLIEMKIIDTEKFLNMPVSTRCLYYELLHRIDGENNTCRNPAKILKRVYIFNF